MLLCRSYEGLHILDGIASSMVCGKNKKPGDAGNRKQRLLHNFPLQLVGRGATQEVVLHSDDEFAEVIAGREMLVGFGGLVEGEGAVDDGLDFILGDGAGHVFEHFGGAYVDALEVGTFHHHC